MGTVCAKVLKKEGKGTSQTLTFQCKWSDKT